MAATTSRKSRRGWENVIGDPVPGNIDGALDELGIEVTRVDDVEHYALCPAHEERTGHVDHSASWSVNEGTGWHHCFSCGWSGSFVDLVAYVADIDHHEAAQWTRARGGIERARALLEAPKASAPLDTSKRISEASLAVYTVPPTEALESRHLHLLACIAYGVMWDPKNERWITPVRDPDRGHLLGWQEKNARIFKNQPYGLKKSGSLFGLDIFAPGCPAILVESPLDCPRILSADVEGAVSSYGAIVSDAQLRLILDRTDTLIVALDNDPAGAIASKKIKDEWSSRLRVKFFNYGDSGAKDPGDMTDEQIRFGVEHAIPSVLVRF